MRRGGREVYNYTREHAIKVILSYTSHQYDCLKYIKCKQSDFFLMSIKTFDGLREREIGISLPNGQDLPTNG